jgi:hypothetical protein
MKLDLDEVYRSVKRQFRVRIKSRFALIFDYKKFEVTLFDGGRMLIKNVGNERVALDVYRDVVKKLAVS